MNYLENTTYIFIPFTYGEPEKFRELIEIFDTSQTWELVRDDIRYMLKYVADKIDSEKGENCQCFHYRLRDEKRSEFGLGTEEALFLTNAYPFQGSDRQIGFHILDVQIFCFSTAVGIIAFKINLENSDPFWIAHAQYYLKKVSREEITIKGLDDKTTLLDISEKLVKEFEMISKMEFFYYANRHTERANTLTYLEMKRQTSYKKELFYLKRCYSEGFLYTENEEIDAEEIYIPSEDTIWGISSEAAVCLAIPEYGRGEFIRGTFYHNFNAQYLFMYVLLLHQKYVLYMFLTNIGVGTYNDLETLENYRHQLYEFETDFVFSCVTEVPQYQNLYCKLMHAFSLKEMYEDVHEPLASLGEVRRKAADDEQNTRDKKVNKALLFLSLLSIFSAFVDSFECVKLVFSGRLPVVWVERIQIGFGIVVLGIAVWIIKSLLKSRK